MDGINLVALAMGLFGISEVITSIRAGGPAVSTRAST
ncbi:tripartite tricarboxylate transporter permease [Oceanimonas sp. NS1]|nr:tripartite tricarboxylate transporter permease [Oceanimonas sp. NS1]